MSALTTVPPAVVLLAVAVAVAVLPRRIGHALGILATGATAAWAVVVPAGTYLTDLQFLGFETALVHVDEFSRLMAIIFGLIGAVAVLYSYASQADSRQTAFALSYVATSVGAVLAGDWLTLLFFLGANGRHEHAAAVWHYGGKAVRAGFRYAVFHGIGGSLLMGAIVWHYVETGTFVFDGTASPASSRALAGLPPAMAAIGIGVNVGFVGLHAWLPDTYPRPHIAASVFLCVFTTKTGVYGMYRAFPDGNVWIAYMGGAMAVFGVFYALLQNDMRRLLSYHIQSQVGYMIAGVGIGTALAPGRCLRPRLQPHPLQEPAVHDRRRRHLSHRRGGPEETRRPRPRDATDRWRLHRRRALHRRLPLLQRLRQQGHRHLREPLHVRLRVHVREPDWPRVDAPDRRRRHVRPRSSSSATTPSSTATTTARSATPTAARASRW